MSETCETCMGRFSVGFNVGTFGCMSCKDGNHYQPAPQEWIDKLYEQEIQMKEKENEKRR